MLNSHLPLPEPQTPTKPSAPRLVLPTQGPRSPQTSRAGSPTQISLRLQSPYPTEAQKQRQQSHAPSTTVADSTTLLNPFDLPLNSDLPKRDTLFVFSNFQSYMRAPHQGSNDVPEVMLRHSSRLLDYARELQENKRSRVNILHIKYRFPLVSIEEDVRRPAPPFAVLMDPVLKIDYKSGGVYKPDPASAIFEHIAKNIDPAPRCIVYAYVGTRATCLHLAILANYCAASIPPIVVLSPAECRIRENLPLNKVLENVVDVPLYSQPPSPDLPPLGLLEKDISPSGTRPVTAQTHQPGSASSCGSNEEGKDKSDKKGKNAPFVRPSLWTSPTSTSGNAYLKAKEIVLRARGIVDTKRSLSLRSGSFRTDPGKFVSFSNDTKKGVTASAVSPIDAGLGHRASDKKKGDEDDEGNTYKVSRGLSYEAAIDLMDFGDEGRVSEEEVDEDDQPVLSLKSTKSKKSEASYKSVAGQQIMRTPRTTLNATKSPGSFVSWRDLIVSHSDPANPEYVDG